MSIFCREINDLQCMLDDLKSAKHDQGGNDMKVLSASIIANYLECMREKYKMLGSGSTEILLFAVLYTYHDI